MSDEREPDDPSSHDATARPRSARAARDVVRAAERELRELERPPGMLARMSSRVRAAASRHFRLAMDELRESRHAASLIAARVTRRERLTPAQAAEVRQQLVDVLKTLPAGVLTAATGAIPVPGAMLVAPWMLQRLGLLPSRWREEAVLTRLREQAGDLRDHGDGAAADRIDGLIEAFEARSEERHSRAEQAAMLSHWDKDGNGTIDEAERTAYVEELGRVAEGVRADPHRRGLYLQLHGHVVGPVRWAETEVADPELPIFVCRDDAGGWVLLAELRSALADLDV